LAVLLAAALAAQAQDEAADGGLQPIPLVQAVPEPVMSVDDDAYGGTYGDSYSNYAETDMWPRYGLEASSLPAEIAEDLAVDLPAPRWGPTPVKDVRILMDGLGLARLWEDRGIRAFGWVETGYTYASTGPGLLSVQPRQNQFGNEALLDQIGLVIQKPLQQDRFDLGWNVRYFAGADAAIGQPGGGIDDPPGNPRFSHDFRDLYLSAHLPVLTEGGMNVKVGRMNTIIGYNGFLAPYRPMYSSDYQFFYSQDGAFTGFLTQLIVNDRLDIWNGMTLGANTFFEKRSDDSYCYIGQVNYWLTDERRTRLTASLHCGPDAIFAAPGMSGDFDTIVELRVQHAWSERFTQVVQSNMGWSDGSPVDDASWYGLYTIGILHMNCQLDLTGRAEWFDDVGGTRTGFDTNYCEVTLGLNWHPCDSLEIRPEVRGDFAETAVFGDANNPTDNSQFTTAISALLKF
jgi:hypothetical protein